MERTGATDGELTYRPALALRRSESAGLLYPMHAIFALLFAAQPFARCPDCGRQYADCYCGWPRR